jgi:nucleoside 2-deoxyribosyltransferase
MGTLSYYHRNKVIGRGLNWRLNLDNWAKDNGIKTFNPAITFLKEINHTYAGNMCVAQNEYYLNKCDIGVVNMDAIDYSPGTIYELCRFKSLGKPVIAFGDKHWSPHINSCISNYCDTLEDVKELLINMFDQNNFN